MIFLEENKRYKYLEFYTIILTLFLSHLQVHLDGCGIINWYVRAPGRCQQVNFRLFIISLSKAKGVFIIFIHCASLVAELGQVFAVGHVVSMVMKCGLLV